MKRHLFTKLGAMLLIVALLLTAAACGTPAAPADEPTTAETPEKTTDPTEDPVSEPGPDLVGGILGSVSSDELSMFLKLDGIDGECKSSKFDHQIEITDFSFGAQTTETGSTAFQSFVFKHKVDKATPKLLENCMKKTWIKFAELSVCRSIAGKPEVFFTVKLDLVVVTRTTVEYDEESGAMIETVELTADRETWTVTSIGLDNSLGGSTEAHYDQSKKC